MNPFLQTIITVLCAVIASSGFWALLVKKMDKKDASKELILGLGHDKITHLCQQYLDRGNWITYSELENLHQYLYIPYEKMGGNGSAKMLMDKVLKELKPCQYPPDLND